MSAMNLVLHCGGTAVARGEVEKVSTPAATETWAPIPHDYLINLVQDELEIAGLRVTSEAHGLVTANDLPGANYFGLFQVEGRGTKYEDHSLVVGLRNSHIKRFGAAFCAGSGVFVCDNLAFSGEIMIGRKHTKNIFQDGEGGLRFLVTDAISKLMIVNQHQEERFEDYKSTNLSNGQAEVIMINALRSGVVTSTQLPKVVQQWDNPDHAEFGKNRNGWRMFNAVTEALKGTSPLELPRRTTKLHSIMDRACESPVLGLDNYFAMAA